MMADLRLSVPSLKKNREKLVFPNRINYYCKLLLKSFFNSIQVIVNASVKNN